LSKRCCVDGCEDEVKSKGLCQKHHTRARIRGDPTVLRSRWDGYSKDGLACGYCGGGIPREFSSVTFCSDRCTKRAKADRPKTLVCEECHTEYEPPPRSSSPCCSEEYRTTRRERLVRDWVETQKQSNPGYQQRRRAAQRRRRARMAEAGVEVFTFTEIAERDGWKCSLCGDRIRTALKHPDPMSGTLNHIIPISRGGAHTRENSQAALLGQLRMFG